MQLSRTAQVKFYREELKEIHREVQEYFETKCSELIRKDEFFLGKFYDIDKQSGLVTFEFAFKNTPYLKNPYVALVFVRNSWNLDQIKNVTYAHIRKKAVINSECTPVRYFKKINENTIRIGFKDIKNEFALKLRMGQIVAFGMADPPIKYLLNLIEITTQTPSKSKAGLILDSTYNLTPFRPQLIEDTNEFVAFYKQRLINEPTIIIQGPPGTGKTTFMASICKELLGQNKSILACSLANKSLIELAKKKKLENKLLEGRILKTNLSSDEETELPGIIAAKDIISLDGHLMLTTYYKMSGLGKDIPSKPIFDYIILEEASQTFIGTIAACYLIAKNVIIVGDPQQLPPVVNQKNPDKISLNIGVMTKSLEYFASSYKCPKYRFISTYRLTERAAQLTGLFYEKTLKSLSPVHRNHERLGELPKEFDQNGGASIYYFDIRNNQQQAFAFILDKVKMLLRIEKDMDIAILSPVKKKGVKLLRNYILPELDLNHNININTIDGVQGMTTSVTILYIPPTNEMFSFDLNRFNVATSRAELGTLIITDEIYKNINPGKGLVADYLDSI